MIIREETVDTGCATEHGVNVGLIIKFILCDLKGALNLFITLLMVSAQPRIGILDLLASRCRDAATTCNIGQEATLATLIITGWLISWSALLAPIDEP